MKNPARLFTLTIFVGSFLLFLVQPMIARLALPKLGGAPAVWNTAMLFYQAVLLAGYLYAHALSRLQIRAQIGVHLALLLVAALTLPIGLRDLAPPDVAANPAPWLLMLLTLSIGPLFFAISAQAPLMQSWFARASGGRDPYFLYAASNAGSLLALIAYPLLVEPQLALGGQAIMWSGGFALLIALVALCAIAARNSPAPVAVADKPRSTVSWRDRVRWTLIAFVPSGMMLSTTTHLTTDIMAMPLLWVIPLGLYLVTFIVAFADGGEGFSRHAARIAPAVLLVLGAYAFLASGGQAVIMASLDLVLLFYVALALHGELARTRPGPDQLTDFYVWVSVGGMLGGLFCGLLAPMLFDSGYEHPILIVLAALLLPATPLIPWFGRLWQKRSVRLLIGGALPVAAIAASWWAGLWLMAPGKMQDVGALMLGVTALLAVVAIGHRLAFATYLTALMLALGGWQALKISQIPFARERSFFGIYSVRTNGERGVREFLHGTTLHGVQSIVPGMTNRPMTYYAPESGAGRALRAMPADSDIAFIGLGAGTLSCYAKPGQRWTAFEIDPLVVRIARTDPLFNYISICKPDLRVDLGDARLRLKAYPKRFDTIAVDAFSSDAIPLHLMTTQAFDGYAEALKPGGLLLVHISNRFIDLEPVVAKIATAGGWTVSVRRYNPPDPSVQPHGQWDTPSWWIALSRDPDSIRTLTADGGWRPIKTRADLRVWTDDYASVLPVIRLR